MHDAAKIIRNIKAVDLLHWDHIEYGQKPMRDIFIFHFHVVVSIRSLMFVPESYDMPKFVYDVSRICKTERINEYRLRIRPFASSDLRMTVPEQKEVTCDKGMQQASLRNVLQLLFEQLPELNSE